MARLLLRARLLPHLPAPTAKRQPNPARARRTQTRPIPQQPRAPANRENEVCARAAWRTDCDRRPATCEPCCFKIKAWLDHAATRSELCHLGCREPATGRINLFSAVIDMEILPLRASVGMKRLHAHG